MIGEQHVLDATLATSHRAIDDHTRDPPQRPEEL